MGKFRLDSPQGTPLDPFAFEKQFTNPNLNNPSQFSGVTDQLEFVTPEKIESGYGTLGNASVAAQIIQETKAANQGAIELAGKGLFNVAKTIGVEIGKTPGYLAGTVGAIGNELFGDGKVFYAYDGEKEYEREAVKARLELNIPHVNPFMYNSTL